ncbi:arginase family protein [Leifsonia sp. fls2-241-R2A-40a]|uniref:arginase family protein n=1 Tax=Leifsonia sp. fls2-241-R2A-40a TaxID=3040290 RepID=UPI0025513E53|nr:arginase family protein [Leifsonia sp. fls2-241-R2A-40a]
MSGASFLVVPQWQGSGSSRAMRLIDGADAIRGDLPAARTHQVPVPASAGESLGTGVNRFSSLVAVKDATEAELSLLEAPVVTVGGDCGAELAAVQHALAAHPAGSVAVVWFDAHGDLNDAESSPSGAFHGMVLRALLGDGPDGLASTGAARLAAGQLVLAGTRALDDGESAFVERSGIRVLGADELDDPEVVVDAVAATGATSVYLHIDLDVLDPSAIDGIGYPEPFGVQPERLTEAIRALRRRFELAGAGLMEFAPESPDAAARDLAVILRILGALTGPTGSPAAAAAEGAR